jgi:hypothetical protein
MGINPAIKVFLGKACKPLFGAHPQRITDIQVLARDLELHVTSISPDFRPILDLGWPARLVNLQANGINSHQPAGHTGKDGGDSRLPPVQGAG